MRKAALSFVPDPPPSEGRSGGVRPGKHYMAAWTPEQVWHLVATHPYVQSPAFRIERVMLSPYVRQHVLSVCIVGYK